MIALAADEDVPGLLIAALRRHIADIDILTTVDRQLLGATDEEQLKSAQDLNRVLLSCDRSLGTKVWARIAAGELSISGLIIARRDGNTTAFLDEMTLLIASTPAKWTNRVHWLTTTPTRGR